MDTIRILHGFDIVYGNVMEAAGPGKTIPEPTMWSTVSNLTGSTYLYNTIDDPLWYEIDLGKLDFSSSRSAAFTTTGWFSPAAV